MRRSAYSDEQMRLFVLDLMAGRPVDEIGKIAGVSERTLYRWRRKFGGLKPFAIQALRRLEQENRRLRREVVIGHCSLGGETLASSPPRVRSDLGLVGSRAGVAQPAIVVGRYAALRTR